MSGLEPIRPDRFCRLVFGLGLVLGWLPQGPGSAQEASLRISGTTPAGSPPAAIRLELRAVGSEYERATGWLQGAAPTPAPANVRADGRFSLAFEGLEPGAWEVEAEAQGFATARYRLEPLVGDLTLPTLELRPAEVVVVTVVDDSGRPLNDARAVAKTVVDDRTLFNAPTSRWYRGYRTLAADEQGALRLESSRGLVLEVDVFSPGFEPATLSNPQADSVLRLERADPRTGLSLRVVDDFGEALAAVVVLNDTGMVLGMTDAQGDWSGHADPQDVLYLLGRDGLFTDFRAPESRSEPLEVRLDRSPRLEGSVVDHQAEAVGGAFVARLRLIVGGPRRYFEWPIYPNFVAADGFGDYSLPVWHDGTIRLHGVADGYRSDVVSQSVGQGEIGRGPTITLSPAYRITGGVTDEFGSPVVDAAIVPESSGSPSATPIVPRSGVTDTQTGATGRFRLSAVDPAQITHLVVSAPGRTPRRWRLPTPTEPSDWLDLEIELDRGLEVVGTLLRADGSAVDDAIVLMRPTPQGLLASYEAWQRSRGVVEAGSRRGGGFSFEGLRPGLWDIRVDAPGEGLLAKKGVEVGEGLTDLGDLVLPPASSLRGVVVDQDDGSPLEGVRVALITPVGWERDFHQIRSMRGGDRVWLVLHPEIVTDRQGRFEVPDLSPGQELTLAFESEDTVPRDFPGIVAPVDDDLTVGLELSSVLSGFLVDERGEPLAGEVWVELDPANVPPGPGFSLHEKRAITLAATGSFSLDGLPPALYRIHGSAEGYTLIAPVSVRVSTGEVIDDLEVVLREGDASLTGRLVDRDGNGVRGEITVMPGDASPSFWSSRWPSATSDGEGRFTLRGLEVGEAGLRIRRRGGGAIERRIDLDPGENRIDLRLDGFSVAGILLAADGDPASGVDLRMAPVGDSASPLSGSTTRTSTDGSFRFVDIVAGSYSIGHGEPGVLLLSGGRERGEFTVRSDISDLELTLAEGFTVRGHVLGLSELERSQLTVRALKGWQPGLLRADGRFEIRDLPGGEVEVAAILHAQGRELRKWVDVSASQDSPEIVFDFESEAWTLAGRVTYRGKAVASQGVSLQRGDGSAPRTATTDYRGEFRFADLEADGYRIEVPRPGAPDRPFDRQEFVLTGDDWIEIELAR